jgi:translation initiation factor 1 (eIF-1/SUI1)
LGELKAGEIREVQPDQVRRLQTFLASKGVQLTSIEAG